VSYFFHEDARLEHLEHVAYYESCQVGLGSRYLAAFDRAMDAVCQAPDRYRIELAPGIRKFRVPGFPYNILYRTVGAEVEVLVVAPHRRRPGYWFSRL
jgi:toxin ParE1/3/4